MRRRRLLSVWCEALIGATKERERIMTIRHRIAGVFVIACVVAIGWGPGGRVYAAEESTPKKAPAEESVVLLARADFVLKNGDEERGIQLLHQAAEQGSAEALYRLAKRYAAGKGVPQDPKQARALMQKAAALGHLAAMREGADYLLQGYGGPKDVKAGFAQLRKAAEGGDPEALYWMGLFTVKGQYEGADASQAVAWLKKAAEKGHKRAHYYMISVYLNGVGVEESISEAYNWAWKGAEAGDLESAYLLGMSLMAGEDIPQDRVEGLKWLQISLVLMGERDSRYKETFNLMREAYNKMMTQAQRDEFERRYVAWVKAHWK